MYFIKTLSTGIEKVNAVKQIQKLKNSAINSVDLAQGALILGNGLLKNFSMKIWDIISKMMNVIANIFIRMSWV